MDEGKGLRSLYKPNLKSLILLTMLVGFFTFQGISFANSVAVSPARVGITATPGVPFQAELEVYGSPDQNMRARAYFHDYEFDLNGQVVTYQAGGVIPKSAASWVTIEPQEFIIPAGESRLLRISGTVPPGTPGGDYWSMYFVEILPFSIMQASGMMITSRVGGSFTITVPGAPGPAGGIIGLEVECRSGEKLKKVTGAITFKNDGDLIVNPTGRVEIRTTTNNVLERIIVQPTKVFPGSKRRILFEAELNLPRGSYVALAVLDYGGQKLAGYPIIFTVER